MPSSDATSGVVRTIALAAACSTGCYVGPGAAGGGDSEGPYDSEAPADTTGSSSGSGGSAPEGEDNACGDKRSVGPTPLRRLTRREYDNTVRDLLDTDQRPAEDFAADERVAGFDANAISLVSLDHIEDYAEAAEALAAAAVGGRWGALAGCDLGETSCVEGFLVSFGRRAFRRPLTAQELAAMVAAYEGGREQWGARAAVQTVLEGILASPHFLYHVELGEDRVGDAVRLAPFEVASRLSYFLWASMPDDVLLDAAEAGELQTPDELESHARRMLTDAKAAATIASFHEQWLGIDELADLYKDPETFPSWDDGLAAKMQAETAAFAREVILDGDASLSTLLTASYTIADPEVAAIYGASPNGQGRVELDPSERAGLLTHASVLASHAHAVSTSVVRRGRLVRERFLCDAVPPPPGDVMLNDPADFAGRLDNPACAACHVLMDPIGRGFDAYSPIGVFDNLFADAMVPPEMKAELTARKLSALDAVAGDLQRLMPALPGEDRIKLEAHLDAVRALENKVQDRVLGIACDPAAPDAGLDPYANQAFPDLARMQMDLMVQALACGRTDVASLQLRNDGGGYSYPSYPDEGIDISIAEHELAHNAESGFDLGPREDLEVFYSRLFAYLLDRLAEVPEGDGTLLDHTVVLWTKHLGRQGHTNDKMLHMIAGGQANTGLEMGRYLLFEDVAHNELLVSVCNLMGLPDTTFGDPDFCTGGLAL